jgi:hypothetical protein
MLTGSFIEQAKALIARKYFSPPLRFYVARTVLQEQSPYLHSYFDRIKVEKETEGNIDCFFKPVQV